VADSQVRGGGQTPTSLRGGTNPVEWIPVRGKKIARGLETPLVISPSGGAAPVLSLSRLISLCVLNGTDHGGYQPSRRAYDGGA
jgi:hypothetical protein